jgi:beta-glucosidase
MQSRLAFIGALALCLIACRSPEHPDAAPPGSASPGVVAPAAPSLRVAALVEQMTLDEKISLLHGAPEDDAQDQGEAGYLPGVPRLQIPPLRFADGPPGVLTRYPATALTATMGLAATFSPEDARANGVVIANDARSHGIDVALQPYLNIHRDQTFARAYNTYGEDPLLTGRIGAALIEGIQGEGVMAQAKHFIGYDGANDVTMDPQTLHEIYLAPFAAAVRAQVSSVMCAYNVIDGAYACNNRELLTSVLRGELKFDGFVSSDWGAVHATPFLEAGDDLEMPGNGTVMESFFEAQVPALGHYRKPLLGPVVNPMPEEGQPPPGPPTIITVPFDHPLGVKTALQQGVVREATIDRAVARILGQMERFGLLDRPQSAAQPAGMAAERVIEANAATVLKTSEDAAVLLKNQSALPLQIARRRSIALIGPGALQDIATGEAGEKALGYPERQISPVDALRRLTAANGVRIETSVADDMTGVAVPAGNLSSVSGPGLQRRDASGLVIAQDRQLTFTLAAGNALPAGTQASWSGSLQVASSGQYRLYLQVLGAGAELEVDGKRAGASGPLQLHGNVLQGPQDNVLPTSDGLDNVRREFEWSAGPHAIRVQVHGGQTGQPVQIRLAWVTPEQRAADYQRAVEAAAHAQTAIVFAWSRGRPAYHLPGDQDQLIADVAAVNPNTIVVLNVSEPIALPWLDKVKAVLLMWYPGDEGGLATANVLLGRVNPAGRLPFTWPQQLEQNVANDPAHPERSSAGVAGRTTYSEGLYVGYRWFDQQRLDPQFPFGYGLSYTHFDYSDLAIANAADGGLDVSLRLRNAGSADGDEVAQVYLGAPQPTPARAQFALRALAAFERVHLAAAESRIVRLHIEPRALEYWSVEQAGWVRASGSRTIFVGASSRALRLQGAVP